MTKAQSMGFLEAIQKMARNKFYMRGQYSLSLSEPEAIAHRERLTNTLAQLEEEDREMLWAEYWRGRNSKKAIDIESNPTEIHPDQT